MDKQYPDMFTELQNVANIMANNICVKILLEIFFSRKEKINLQKSNNFKGIFEILMT